MMPGGMGGSSNGMRMMMRRYFRVSLSNSTVSSSSNCLPLVAGVVGRNLPS